MLMFCFQYKSSDVAIRAITPWHEDARIEACNDAFAGDGGLKDVLDGRMDKKT